MTALRRLGQGVAEPFGSVRLPAAEGGERCLDLWRQGPRFGVYGAVIVVPDGRAFLDRGIDRHVLLLRLPVARLSADGPDALVNPGAGHQHPVA